MTPLEAAELEFGEAARASAAATRCGARCDNANERGRPYVLCRVHFRLQKAWRDLETARVLALSDSRGSRSAKG